ncbi:Set1 complex component spp1 [Choanephora cucurbitarum]|uniref:Set1 complex component spp1 n=1 Tax=Choanephora cucurbitarum TaxID=101091 RepID=A0A1C7NIV4_9FUNG|nr:Set1 complex component spp1 [Choanephora cucurbitarum]
MSQQIENNSDHLLRPIESNSANRLPLRKRIAPVLKWQPVETPEEHHKQTYPPTSSLQIASPYPVHSISDASDNGIELDEAGQRPKEEQPSSPPNNRPTKKVKRGRPPLQRNQQSESSIPSTPNSPSLLQPSPYSLLLQPTNDKITKPDKNALYCICKSPYDGTRFMIACDKCDQWFHGECIGISEKQGEFIDLYFCDDCAKMTGKRTIWKPKCANTNCNNAARIGTNQGHLSKYCTDSCGMQVARARVEQAEMKKKNSEEGNSLSDYQYNPLSRSKLSSYADMDDRSRLLRVKEEKLQAKQVIGIGEKKLSLLSFSIQNNKDQEICGFDSRLVWPESIWEKVEEVRPDGLVDSHQQLIHKSFSICQSNKKCSRHLNWQKIKAFELEQERSEQFIILTMLERERQQIQARMRKRREEVDLVQFLDNGTLHHS